MDSAVDQIYLKYLGQKVSVKIDRPLYSEHPEYGFAYQLNYGFILDTMAPDGEEIDAYIVGVDIPLKNFTGRCIAIIHRLNDEDDKLIVAADGMKIDDDAIRQLTNFQEKFFESVIVRN